ncbi:MAG: phosphoribosyltransferase [Thermoplasmataceae archaeon]
MDFRAKIVTWDEIERWCNRIRDQIIGKFRPDIIVGLSRGGLVPARILSDRLWIKDLISIKTEHWGITATRSGQAILHDPGKLNLEGRNVLVVDDITDTGQSMSLAYEFVKKQSPNELRTATMLHITRSKFIPDYYSEVVNEDNWAWFIFPWNVYEDLENLIGRIITKPMTFTQIESALRDQFDLNVGSRHLMQVLGDFVTSGKLKRVDSGYAQVSPEPQ